MHRAIHIALVAVTLGGCAHTLSVPDAPETPNDLLSYFWPQKDTSYHYYSASDSGQHTIVLTKTGGITDLNPVSGTSSVLTQMVNSGSLQVTGISAANIFGLDAQEQIVAATSPTTSSNPIVVSSIAGFQPDPRDHGELYFVSGNDLYYNVPGNQPDKLGSLPQPNMSLREGNNRSVLFAIQVGGNTVAYTNSPRNSNWTVISIPSASSGITAFSPGLGDDGGPGNPAMDFWVASGFDIYHVEQNNTIKLKTNFLSTVMSLEPLQGGMGRRGLHIGLQNGQIFEVDFSENGGRYEIDTEALIGTIGNNPVSYLNEGYVGAVSGVYDEFDGFAKVDSRSTTALYDAHNGSFQAVAGFSDGSVYLFSHNPFYSGPYPNPNQTIAPKQFAFQESKAHTFTTDTVFVLCGGDVFAHDAVADGNGWVPLRLATAGATVWPSGSFTLLKNNATSWLAGYIIRTDGGVTNVFDYNALSTASSSMNLDGHLYSDVISVTYSPQAIGSGDPTSVPTYTIYFARGIGPIRIEKAENGVTQVTRLVK